MKKIFFYTKNTDDFFPPKSAKKNIPDWYKKTETNISKEEYLNNIEFSSSPGTIKKCMPIFDSMTAGYILFTPADIEIIKHEDGFIAKSPYLNLIGSHFFNQATFYPQHNEGKSPYFKINNPWNIKTPKGYSCLFLNPMHNPNPYFTIIPGIVDTDNYLDYINFPFILNNLNWEGIIPAGTPMVQIVPIKRNSWKSKIYFDKNPKEQSRAKLIHKTFSRNKYKKFFWEKKNYD